MLLRPTRTVEIAGRICTLACDFRALYAYEQRGVHDPRMYLWAMLQTSWPDLEPSVAGQAGIQDFEAAMSLIVPSFGVPESQKSSEAAEEPDWFDLWGTGRFDLGLPEDEFWMLTPRMFGALCERLLQRKEHEYYCAGIPAAEIVNGRIDPKEMKPLEPIHFVPTRAGLKAWEERKQKRLRDESESLRRNFHRLGGMLGAVPIPK